MYFVYDEYFEQYTCEINLDEDEMMRFISGNYIDCPYYATNDDYKIVRKQN